MHAAHHFFPKGNSPRWETFFSLLLLPRNWMSIPECQSWLRRCWRNIAKTDWCLEWDWFWHQHALIVFLVNNAGWSASFPAMFVGCCQMGCGNVFFLIGSNWLSSLRTTVRGVSCTSASERHNGNRVKVQTGSILSVSGFNRNKILWCHSVFCVPRPQQRLTCSTADVMSIHAAKSDTNTALTEKNIWCLKRQRPILFRFAQVVFLNAQESVLVADSQSQCFSFLFQKIATFIGESRERVKKWHFSPFCWKVLQTHLFGFPVPLNEKKTPLWEVQPICFQDE